jgi:hypothetical protein
VENSDFVSGLPSCPMRQPMSLAQRPVFSYEFKNSDVKAFDTNRQISTCRAYLFRCVCEAVKDSMAVLELLQHQLTPVCM